MDNIEFSLIAILTHALIALTAGIMKEINKVANKRLSIMKMVANGAVSSFVGVTVFFLTKTFELSPYLTAFCTSVAGWAGGPLMEFFSDMSRKIMEKRIGIIADTTPSHSLETKPGSMEIYPSDQADQLQQ
jgi:uncharacterized membrane protein YdcZ (DUF606 family)